MTEVTVEQLAGEIAALMEERLGIGGDGLAAKLRRGGRLLPRHVRRDATAVAEAVPLMQNPKLMKMVNLPRLEAGERRVVAYLRTVNRTERRMGMFLGILGGVAFSLIAVFALFVGVLLWQGLL